MAIDYSWEFTQLATRPKMDAMADVIIAIHWRLTATDGARLVSTHGVVFLGAPDPREFTAFSGITRGWIKDRVKEGLVAQLPDLKSGLANRLAPAAAVEIVAKPSPALGAVREI